MNNALLLGPLDAVAPRQRAELLRSAIGAAGFRPAEVITSKQISIADTLATVEASVLEHDPELAVVMLGPFVQGLAAGAVLRRVFGIPVVYDLRDPWHVPGGWRGLRSRASARALQWASLRGAPTLVCAGGLQQLAADAGSEAVTVLTGCADEDPDEALLRDVWRSAEELRATGSRVVFYGGKVGGAQYPVEPALSAVAADAGCALVVATSSEVPPGLSADAVVLGTIPADAVRCWHRCADVSFIGEGHTSNTEWSVPVKAYDLLVDADHVVGWLPRSSEGWELLRDHDGFVACDPGDIPALLDAVRAVAPKSSPSAARPVPDRLSRRTSVARAAELLAEVAAT
jgi:hypothetical protein